MNNRTATDTRALSLQASARVEQNLARQLVLPYYLPIFTYMRALKTGRGNGMVYQRKESKYWWLSYSLGQRKQVWESSKTTDKDEAENLLKKRLAEVAEGKRSKVAKNSIDRTVNEHGRTS